MNEIIEYLELIEGELSQASTEGDWQSLDIWVAMKSAAASRPRRRANAPSVVGNWDPVSDG